MRSLPSICLLAALGCAPSPASAPKAVVASVEFPEDLSLVVYCDGEPIQALDAKAWESTIVTVPYSGCDEVTIRERQLP